MFEDVNVFFKDIDKDYRPTVLYKDNYEELANAIVVQAAMDYREEYKKLLVFKKHNKKKSSLIFQRVINNIKEIENFFRSGYYELLTKADCEYIINNLREEIEAVMP